MRLIDADELIKLLNRKHFAMASRKQIYGMPTIKTERNVGTWEKANRNKKSYTFICSECGRNAWFLINHFDENGNRVCKYKYCPNCGSEMRDGEK